MDNPTDWGMTQPNKTFFSVRFGSNPRRWGWYRQLPLLSLISWSIGCQGCYHPAVVPPAASISRPQRPQIAPVLEVPEIPVPQDPDPGPVTPVAKDNPWKPETAARDWKYIVLHHTATVQGDVESIHESHLKNKDKNGNPWLGIGYHFVIGNGHGMQDGEIQPTFRWKQQLQGAHAGVSDYNQLGVGIVLVGNFENGPPTEAQVKAAKRLTRILAKEYEIETRQIVGHSDVKATECPGAHFPLSEIRDSVAAMLMEKQMAVTRPLRPAEPAQTN